MLKKKILIIGPFSDFGGREIEVAFIEYTLSKVYDVHVCSTGYFSDKSQIYQFNKKINAFSLSELLQKKYILIKLLNVLCFLKNLKKTRLSKYSNNSFSKKYFNYKSKIKLTLETIIPDYDLIFICSQLSSDLIPEIVQIANKNKIKIILRTTGTITKNDYDYLNMVDCFVHHSYDNANNLDSNYNFKIIDQCAFNEAELFKTKLLNKKVSNFLILSRLSPEKGIEQAIEYFLHSKTVNDKLFIAGNGHLELFLKNKFMNQSSIIFLGFMEASEYVELFNKIDCIIISSPEESGPLTGIEAMCAGKIVISTRVGAMPERYCNTLNNFWYNYNDLKSFQKTFNNVKSLDNSKIIEISKNLKNHYQIYYSLNIIGEKYLKLVENFTL